MAITYRPMRPKDVHECVDIVAAHPVMRQRYGDVLCNLKAVWLALIGREAFRTAVFEDSQTSHAGIIGVGVSVFVSDDFLRALKQGPFFWVGPELTKWLCSGQPALLSDREVRQRNARGGLTVATWEGAIRAESLHCPEVLTAFCSAFIENHQGFPLNEILGQGMTRDTLDLSLRSGFLMLQEDGRYADSVKRPLDEIFEKPHHIGLTRELALSSVGSWVGSLFVYQAPQCGFRPSEQRLLLTALRGGTDEELANDLGVSLSAVKKMWLSIYERASAHLPSLLPNRASMEEPFERGREKKQRLLNYLRDHPEELRPASP